MEEETPKITGGISPKYGGEILPKAWRMIICVEL
jgi:hypothetical protein